ncbi:piggyBac transposable element-derived protein 3-like [Anabrus simplex]|uniref:piggyBac transposable element-derived protein 3-like n=1 Tax=Anabrus simplex TaxID=316456 RepID=UPI0035A37058
MAQSLTSAEILAQLEVNAIDFDGNTSEIEGLSSDEDDETFDPMLEEEEEEEEEEHDSSEGQPDIVGELNSGAQNRNPPPWRHTNDFQPLPPAPAFEEGVWQGKEQEPHEYFLRYIPTYFFDSVSSCTNQNCLARKGKSLNTTAQEIQVFFGISITMSYLRFPRISMYWAAGTRVAKISDKMSRKHFFSIRSNLKIVVDSDISDDTRSADKFWKVRPLLHLVREGCLQNPRTKRVAIDEQMIPFWGHTSARQYVRGKPNPCGLKNFVCASPDGLPLDFFMYEGKGDTIIEQYDILGIGGKVVIRLAKSLPEGCIIYMDRFFTSVELLDCLHSDAHCQGTGTIQKSRIPPESRLQTDSEMQR